MRSETQHRALCIPLPRQPAIRRPAGSTPARDHIEEGSAVVVSSLWVLHHGVPCSTARIFWFMTKHKKEKENKLKPIQARLDPRVSMPTSRAGGDVRSLSPLSSGGKTKSTPGEVVGFSIESCRVIPAQQFMYIYI